MKEIIIITYNQPKLEARCVNSVMENMGVDTTLTVYNNFRKKESLSRVWNRLISRSDAEYICLLNSDTVVELGWLDKLIDELKTGVGAVGPVSNRAGHQSLPRGTTTVEVSMLSGFCLVFPKEIWEEVGGFNESYFIYFEDDDFSNRIKRAGYKLMLATHVSIFHEERGTTRHIPETEKIFEQSKATYESLWGKWEPPKIL